MNRIRRGRRGKEEKGTNFEEEGKERIEHEGKEEKGMMEELVTVRKY